MLNKKISDPIRHAIEFYGLKPIIPNSLKSFKGFLFNPQRGRISFLVAEGTGFSNPLKIYSTDPKIQDFNSIFSKANKNIDWKKIKSYDFIDKELKKKQTPRPTPRPVRPTPQPNPVNPNLIPINKKEDNLIITNNNNEDNSSLPVMIAGAALLFYALTKKKKRKK